MHPIDERMLAFVAWHGEIPTNAVRIEDHRAREHAASWIRRILGVGIVHAYVIGYELGHQWWTLFFDRIETVSQERAECWQVEAYDYTGKSWSQRYCFLPQQGHWRRLRGVRTAASTARAAALTLGLKPPESGFGGT